MASSNPNSCTFETTEAITETIVVESEIVEIETHVKTVPNKSKNTSESSRTIQHIYSETTPSSPKTKSLNKSAYIKLHRSRFHHPKSSNVGALKEKFEHNQPDNDCTNKADANKDTDTSKNDVYNGGAVIKNQIDDIQISSPTENKNSIQDSDSEHLIEKSGDHENHENDILTKTTTNIEKLQNKLSSKLPVQAVESLRNKYSPASFGYPRIIPSSSIESRVKKVHFALSFPQTKPIPPPRHTLKSPSSPIKGSPEKLKVTIKNVPTSSEAKKTPEIITTLEGNTTPEICKTLEINQTPQIHKTPEINKTREISKTREVNTTEIYATTEINTPPEINTAPETTTSLEIKPSEVSKFTEGESKHQVKEEQKSPVHRTKPLPSPRKIFTKLTQTPREPKCRKDNKIFAEASTDTVEDSNSDKDVVHQEVEQADLKSDFTTSDSETQTDCIVTLPTSPKPSVKPSIPKKPDFIAEDRKLKNERPTSAEFTYQKRYVNYRRPLSNIETKKFTLPTIISEEEIDRDNIVFAKPEAIHLIVRRSSSEDSETEVTNQFKFLEGIDTMEKKKDKKRSNSFRKILTGGFFGKDKKRDEDKKKAKEDKSDKSKKVDNHVFSDNVRNESNFTRNSNARHTFDNSYIRGDFQKSGPSNNSRMSNDSFPFSDDNHRQMPGQIFPKSENFSTKGKVEQTTKNTNHDMETRFAEMHINRYNQIRDNFSNPGRNSKYEGYVDMDNINSRRTKENFSNMNSINKFIDTSSSNTISSESRSDTYENALIAQAELLQRRDRENKIQQERNDRMQNRANARNRFFGEHSNSPESFSETPPRAQETYQNLQLIKPKALIPINSERPLPNPYHNGHNEDSQNSTTIERNLNMHTEKELHPKSSVDNKQKVENENPYGTVYDIKSVPAQVVVSRNSHGVLSSSLKDNSQHVHKLEAGGSRPMSPNPRSPSLEGSKLRLPSNREKVELQPRIKSPIPQAKVSTDKIIATELLKNKSEKKDDKRTTPSHQRLEIDIDYPDNSLRSTRSSEQSMSPRGNYSLASPRSRSSLADSNDSPSNRARSQGQNTESLSRTSLKESPSFEGYKIEPNYRVKSPTPLNTTSSPTQTEERNLEQYLEAAEWQIRQRELAASPSIVMVPKQSAAANEPVQLKNSLSKSNTSIPTRSPILYSYSPSNNVNPMQAVHLSPSRQEIRASTPVNLPQSLKLHSPSKAEMRQQVEAFCWKELKKLKEKEEQEIYQLQMSNYGHAEDPVVSRRCRSVSPTSARGRRSLSLPRDPRSSQRGDYVRGRQQPIPENRISQVEATYGYVTQAIPPNQYFVRNSPQRRTIDTTYRSRRTDGSEVEYRPIFKRGSLTYYPQEQQQNFNKKVSFPTPQNQQSPQVWPTRNGFTQSPPTRRVVENRDSYLDDEVFLPGEGLPQNNSQNTPVGYVTYEMPLGNKVLRGKESIYEARNTSGDGRPQAVTSASNGSLSQENIYGSRRLAQENPYGTRTTDPRTLQEDPYGKSTGPKIKNLRQEDLYGSRPANYLPAPANDVTKVDSHTNMMGDGQRIPNTNSLKRNEMHDHNLQVRESLMNKDASRQEYVTANKNARHLYEQRRSMQADRNEPLYGSKQQVSRANLPEGTYEEQQQQRPGYERRITVHRSPSDIYALRRQVQEESPYESKQSIRRYVIQDGTQLRKPPPANMQQYIRESPYGSRQSFNNISNPVYGSRQSMVEPIYSQRQVTVSNKVCDMYGKIHDSSSRQVVSPTYGQVHETGVLYGQLQRPPRNESQQPPAKFVRGSRLTASANDMYKRHPQMVRRLPMDPADYGYDHRANILTVRPATEIEVAMQAPNRPLPPIPVVSKSKFLVLRRESNRRYAPVYDDTSSETSEVQRIMQNGAKSAPRNPGK